MRICEVPNCGRKHYGRGLCSAHYQRKRKHGRLHTVVMRGEPTLKRLMAKVRIEGECWIFTGTTASGYGMIRDDDRNMRRVHGVTYGHFVGDVPEGLELDHLCRRRACCNPQHLEAVTHAVNMQRACEANRPEECLRGHPLNGDNLYVTPKGHHQCRECQRERTRRWRAEQRAEVL